MEALGIDYKLLIAQTINFVLFLFIFKKFISKPFFKFLDREKEKQNEKDRILIDLEKKEKALVEREKKVMQDAKEEVLKIITDAKKQGLAVREEIIKKAGIEGEEIREKNKKMLEAEREKMYAEIKSHIIKTSAQIARETLKGFINEKRQGEIIKTLLQSGKVKTYEN